MQTTPSHSERTKNIEAPETVPHPPSTSSRIIADTDSDPSSNENHPPPVFNENNKRPRVASPVVATASILSNPPLLGPAVSTPGSSTTANPIPSAVIEGSQPKRAMSEEHLSSRGESPVINLPNGQPNAATSVTKLSEVTFPAEGAETVVADMKPVDPAQTEVEQGSRGVTSTESTIPARNQGMSSDSRPPLKEQVALIRGMSSLEVVDLADMTPCSNRSCHQRGAKTQSEMVHCTVLVVVASAPSRFARGVSSSPESLRLVQQGHRFRFSAHAHPVD